MASLAELLAYKQKQAEMLNSLPKEPTLGQRLENLSYAAGEGFSDQLRGLQQLVTHPVQSAKDIYAGVKTAVQNPRQALQAASEGIKQATSSPEAATRFIAQNFSPAELATGLGKVGTMRQIFVGKGSKTWDKAAHEAALKLEKEGATPEQIWEQTGNWRGPDKQWRQEISDANSMPGHKYLSWGEGKDLQAGDTTTVLRQKALLHPKLSAAYPDTKDIGVRLRPGGREEAAPSGGAYYPEMDYISVGATRGGAANRSTMLHELQHAIQQREGFAKGGSTESVSNVVADARNKISKITKSDKFKEGMEKQNALNEKIMNEPVDPNNPYWTSPQLIKEQEKLDRTYPILDKWRKLSTEVKNWETLGTDELYRRLAGEAEARAVQSRMNLTEAERRKVFPEQSYDVPVKDLIIRKK